jgi:hypothetical protein
MKTHVSVFAILTLAIVLIASVGTGTVQASQPTEPNLHPVALAPLHSTQLDPRHVQLTPELLFDGLSSAMTMPTMPTPKAKPVQRADSVTCVADCIVGCLGIGPCISLCVMYQCIYNYQ